MASLEPNDVQAREVAIYLPHVRFASERINIYLEAGNNPMDLFERVRREDD